MTRFEEVLLERMTVRRWLVSVVLVATIGFFAGREYLKWEIRSAMQKAVATLGTQFKANTEEYVRRNDEFVASMNEKIKKAQERNEQP